MAFDKFLDKAKKLANDPKVKDKLSSDKAEQVTDSFLDKAAGVADSVTGGKHTDKIQKARDAADRAVGSENGPNETGQGDTGQNDTGQGDTGRGERPRTDDPHGEDGPQARDNG